MVCCPRAVLTELLAERLPGISETAAIFAGVDVTKVRQAVRCPARLAAVPGDMMAPTVWCGWASHSLTYDMGQGAVSSQEPLTEVGRERGLGSER